MFSMLLLILADNFLLLYVGWEAVGLCSYLLIGYWYKKPSAAGAAKKAFIVNRVGDFGFGLGVILIWTLLGSLAFEEVFAGVVALEWQVTLIAVLLFAGAVGKSAQFPLHVWLPDAMEGPTPVSALIHAATMVNAGVYLVARSNPIFAEGATAMAVVAAIGVFTAVLAAAIALTQNDIKKVLAYSTVSQLAYMFFAGIGAWVAAIFHLLAHGFFKGPVHGVGSVIHGAGGEQDMRFMGGLREKMRWTYVTMVIGSLALAGILARRVLQQGRDPVGGVPPRVRGLLADRDRGRVHDRVLHVPDDLPDLPPVVARAGGGLAPRPRERVDHGRPRSSWPCPPRWPASCSASRPRAGPSTPGWRTFHGAEELGTGILPGSIAAEAALSGEAHGFELFGLGGLLLLVGAGVGVAGILLARRWYVQDPEAPVRFVERIPFGLGPGMYRASVNKYYFDDLYQFFARGGVLVSNALWWFDEGRWTGSSTAPAGWRSGSAASCAASRPGASRTTGWASPPGCVIVLLVYATVVR